MYKKKGSFEWIMDGPDALSSEHIGKVRDVFEKYGEDCLVIVKHWFYCGMTSPVLITFTDLNYFLRYIEESVKPGDAVDVWSAWDVCKTDSILVSGKKPDAEGYVPSRGAY